MRTQDIICSLHIIALTGLLNTRILKNVTKNMVLLTYSHFYGNDTVDEREYMNM